MFIAKLIKRFFDLLQSSENESENRPLIYSSRPNRKGKEFVCLATVADNDAILQLCRRRGYSIRHLVRSYYPVVSLFVLPLVASFFGSHKWGASKRNVQSGQSPHVTIRHKERGQSSSSTSLGAWPNP